MRLDKFLKVTRLLKRRTVAHDACEGNKVTVGGKVAKPSFNLKVGDIITMKLGGNELSVKVLQLKEHCPKDYTSEMYEVINS